MTNLPTSFQPGFTTIIGTHTFSTEEVREFATQFAPLAQHLRQEKPQVVGLHVSSVWMALQRAYIAETTENFVKQGITPAIFGPSPGLEYMNWPEPAFAGDIVTYENHTIDIRETGSRPGWYVMTNLVKAKNQTSALVLEFQSAVFISFQN